MGFQAMSVIAALTCSTSGSTWIGSDTLMCSATLRQIVGPKWIRHRPWALGVAGHLRALNLFQYHAAELLGDLSHPFDFATRARELRAGARAASHSSRSGSMIVGITSRST